MINIFCNFHDESVGEINCALLLLYNFNLTALEMQAPIQHEVRSFVYCSWISLFFLLMIPNPGQLALPAPIDFMPHEKKKKKVKWGTSLWHDFMTALDDSFILTCISIPGAEYTWIKSEFPKYRNILSESKWYSHIEMRLHNIRLYFDVNAFTFSVFQICSTSVTIYVQSCSGLVLCCTSSPLIVHYIPFSTITWTTSRIA